MPRSNSRLALLPAILCLQPQVRVTVPDSNRPQGTAEVYGDPVQVELTSIAFDPEIHQRHHVSTRGRFDMLEPPQYYVLGDGGARVLLLLGHGLAKHDADTLMGRGVEVRGIVRAIRPKVYVPTPAGPVDLDLIEDPELPVLPGPSFARPRVSITVLALFDTSDSGGGASESEGELTIGDILAEPARYSGKTVRLVGRFRGRNLYADLPAGSQRNASDWVLHDGEAALWVSGKPPRGKGWSLDPDYKADTARWLEVSGRPEVVDGVVYLRASKLALTKHPRSQAADETRR